MSADNTARCGRCGFESLPLVPVGEKCPSCGDLLVNPGAGWEEAEEHAPGQTSAQAPLISTEAEERIRALYDEGRLGEAQRIVLEEIEKSFGRRGETMLPARGEILAESRSYRPVVFVRNDEAATSAEFVFFNASWQEIGRRRATPEERATQVPGQWPPDAAHSQLVTTVPQEDAP